MKESHVTVSGREVKLTNLDKLIWPEGLTKAHLVKYYSDIASYILPHLYNRPVVMKRYPHGLEGEWFYQKEIPDYAPAWIERHPVEHSEKVVNYILCNDIATLVWLSNQVTIEIHSWISDDRERDYEHPDIAVIDLDPPDGYSFHVTLELALLVRKALEEFNLVCFPKTSGARGLHLFVPIKKSYTWQSVTASMKFIAELVVSVCPEKATVERKVDERKGKVYIDYLQNGRGKTMVAPYSLRPLPIAPVSTPLFWWEIEKGDFQPKDFNIETTFPRLEKYGDVFKEIINMRQSIDKILKIIE